MVSVTKISKQRVPRSGQNEGVTTYIPPEVKRELEVWASEEDRSVSWLVGKLLEEAVKQRKKAKKRGGSPKKHEESESRDTGELR